MPMLSFNTWVPSCSIRAASSTTGPLTSYNTFSNLLDFLNSLILLPSFLLKLNFSSGTSFWIFSIGFSSVFPSNQSGSTPRTSAKNWSISLRGTVFPDTYWLMWLFPSLMPFSSARRTRSTCFIFFCCNNSFNRIEKIELSILTLLSQIYHMRNYTIG